MQKPAPLCFSVLEFPNRRSRPFYLAYLESEQVQSLLSVANSRTERCEPTVRLGHTICENRDLAQQLGCGVSDPFVQVADVSGRIEQALMVVLPVKIDQEL